MAWKFVWSIHLCYVCVYDSCSVGADVQPHAGLSAVNSFHLVLKHHLARVYECTSQERSPVTCEPEFFGDLRADVLPTG